MSVDCLDGPYRQPTVADELEGFLHSLLYHSLRFLRHNVNPVWPLVQGYFDQQNVVGKKLAAPLHKRTCVQHLGSLVDLDSSDPIVFKRPNDSPHALNKIFAKLFKMFHARYVVLAYNRKLEVLKKQLEAQLQREAATDEASRASPTPYHGECDGEGVYSDRFDVLQMEEKEDNDEGPESKRRDIEHVEEEEQVDAKRSDEIRAQIEMLQRPTEEQNGLAKECDEHQAFIKILTENIGSRDWDKVDRIADDRLGYYVQSPPNRLARTDPIDAPSTNKREVFRMVLSTNNDTVDV